MCFQHLKFQYCISCEQKVILNGAGWHGVMVRQDDFYICEGPFTESGPEPLPEYWQDELTEPSADELAEMNRNAEELLLSLE